METPRSQWTASTMQLATLVLIFVVVYFVASIVSRALNIADLLQRQNAMESTYRSLVQEIATLTDELNYMQTDSYIEQGARTVLLWGRPGEKLFIPLDGPRLAPVPRRP